jgi:hypothetical protein
LQNIAGNHVATWRQKLAADFHSLQIVQAGNNLPKILKVASLMVLAWFEGEITKLHH